MIKRLFFGSFVFLCCFARAQSVDPSNYASTLAPEPMKAVLYRLASDEMEGRETGQPGQHRAALYIDSLFRSFGLKPSTGPSFLLPFQFAQARSKKKGPFAREKNIHAENVLGYIPGKSRPDEYVFITAHYDHLGVRDGKIYYGADDDGSGTTALLILANAFSKAYKDGKGPERSVVFLANAGEEKGLKGSDYYVNHPVFPLQSVVADLNIDMIGRIDEKHSIDTNYVYVIGSAMLSSGLKEVSEKANNTYIGLALDYTFDDPNDANRFYYRSDHYNFAKNNVPVIFYFNGVHEDYHKPSDTPDKIHYALMAKRAQLVFYTAWELANRKERVVVDKETQQKERKTDN